MTTRNVTVIPARKRIGNSANAEELPKLRVAAYCRVSTDSEEQEVIGLQMNLLLLSHY
jgi:site-specific DNA recombinase